MSDNSRLLALNTSESISIEGIGPVRLERSHRARRLVISISASKGVRVAVPPRVSFAKAREFVFQKQKWVHKHLAIVEQAKSQRNALDKLGASLDPAVASKKLLDRLNQLASAHRFNYHKVCIRRQRTRWGSCSARNSISLNLKLVLLPEELMDYVILHELVHTRIHNHGKRFWEELGRYVANARDKARILRASY